MVIIMKELIKILNKMDIPESRKDLSNISNIRWLSRNIHFRNSNHKNYDKAVKIIKQLLEEN